MKAVRIIKVRLTYWAKNLESGDLWEGVFEYCPLRQRPYEELRRIVSKLARRDVLEYSGCPSGSLVFRSINHEYFYDVQPEIGHVNQT